MKMLPFMRHWSMYRYLVADKYRMVSQKLAQFGPRVFNSAAVAPLAVVFGTAALAKVYVDTTEAANRTPASPHSSGIGLSPGVPGQYEDLQRMKWHDLIPFYNPDDEDDS